MWKAQGKRAAARARSAACIGGDRTSGYLHAKEQLFRTLDDTNPDPALAAIEDAVMDAANQLTVGLMGFGGKTSLIGCKIAALNRLPASFFFASPSHTTAGRSAGWRHAGRALRRDSGVAVPRGDRRSAPMLTPEQLAAGFPRTGREVRLAAPISDEQIPARSKSDVVPWSGRMFTGRDAVHASYP